MHLSQQLRCHNMCKIVTLLFGHDTENRHNNDNNKQLWADQPCVTRTPGLSNWTDVGTL